MRTQEFLGTKRIVPATVVDAKKARLTESDALDMLSQIDDIYAAKGKKVVHLHLASGDVSRAAIVAAIIGPSGNLRAPALRRGRTLLVGFNKEAVAALLA